MREEQQEGKPPALARAIRVTGIAPIALLVVSLASHDLFPGRIPHWFQPIIDKEVAVLTLSAGHAGIIGLPVKQQRTIHVEYLRAVHRCISDGARRTSNHR